MRKQGFTCIHPTIDWIWRISPICCRNWNSTGLSWSWWPSIATWKDVSVSSDTEPFSSWANVSDRSRRTSQKHFHPRTLPPWQRRFYSSLIARGNGRPSLGYAHSPGRPSFSSEHVFSIEAHLLSYEPARERSNKVARPYIVQGECWDNETSTKP